MQCVPGSLDLLLLEPLTPLVSPTPSPPALCQPDGFQSLHALTTAYTTGKAACTSNTFINTNPVSDSAASQDPMWFTVYQHNTLPGTLALRIDAAATLIVFHRSCVSFMEVCHFSTTEFRLVCHSVGTIGIVVPGGRQEEGCAERHPSYLVCSFWAYFN